MSADLDYIYIAASAHDARFTRICVASVRHFYPQVPVRLLVGGPLQQGLAAELARDWDVGVADIPAGDYGWGYVKLEPLFGPAGERFMVLDSDTVMAGPVLQAWDGDAPFLVDDETLPEADARRLYYDWDALRAVDPAAAAPQFLFNSGQWFGTAGILTRNDFELWLDWSMPPRLRHPQHFMPGDQGVLNYVLNAKAAREGLTVARKKIMRWPAHGMQDLDAQTVAAHRAPPLVVHWAGLKKPRQSQMIGADLLALFERQYYGRRPGGGVRRMLAGARHAWDAWAQEAGVRAQQRLEKIAGEAR